MKSRYAVRRFRGAAASDPAALGRSLGVGTLINGSVRRSQHRLRVEVELMNTATGTRVWGDKYDRTDTDLLALETEVAQAIATKVAGQLDAKESATLSALPTRSAPAYDHFLRGNYLLAQRTPVDLASAITEYEEAVRLDPGFSRPLARTALAYAILCAWEWPHPRLSYDTMLARGTRLAATALARDSSSSDAWLAWGMTRWFQHSTDWSEAARAHDRAVALDPTNAEAHTVRGVTLMVIGQDSLAADAFQRALALDPRRPISLMRLGDVRFLLGRRAEAERLLDSALAVAPGFLQGYVERAQIRLARHDASGATADLETNVRLSGRATVNVDPFVFGLLAEAAAQRGDTARARERVATMLATLGRSDGLRPSAAMYLALGKFNAGDREGALRALERAADHGPFLSWGLRWPDFDLMRSDPRFKAVFAGSVPHR